MMPSTLPKLLTMTEAAEALKVSVATLRDWRHQGFGPPSALLGRRVVYREADVLAWVDQQFNTQRRGA